jgi:hypothetical protein
MAGLLARRPVRCKAAIHGIKVAFLRSENAVGVTIRNPEAERKIREVARLMGVSVTAALIDLLDEKLREISARKVAQKKRSTRFPKLPHPPAP